MYRGMNLRKTLRTTLGISRRHRLTYDLKLKVARKKFVQRVKKFLAQW